MIIKLKIFNKKIPNILIEANLLGNRLTGILLSYILSIFCNSFDRKNEWSTFILIYKKVFQ